MQQPSIDHFLQLIAHATNHTSIEFPLTVDVNGMRISGHTTSALNYARELERSMKAASYSARPDGDGIVERVREFVGDIFSSVVEAAEEAANKPLSNGIKDDDLPIILHMKNVRFYAPGVLPHRDTLPAPLWRCRLSAIQGYSFGTIPVPENN